MGQADDLQGLARRLVEPLRAFFVSWGSGYIQGTYTPEYYGGTTAGVTTYAANGQVGAFTRLGNRVDFTLRVEWTNATGTGEARMSLPYTAANVTNQNFAVSVVPFGVTYTQDFLVAQILEGTDYVALRSPVSNGASTVPQVEPAGTLLVSGWYLTS